MCLIEGDRGYVTLDIKHVIKIILRKEYYEVLGDILKTILEKSIN